MRMYCIVARDSLKAMNGNRGKLAAQVGHAFLHAYWDAENRHTGTSGFDSDWSRSYSTGVHLDYRRGGMAKKVTLAVDTVDELRTLEAAYRSICGVSLVEDAGLTCFDGPTVTCLGIGPLTPSQVGDDLKELKVLI